MTKHYEKISRPDLEKLLDAALEGRNAAIDRAEKAEAMHLQAKKAVHRYMVAVGPHLSNDWKELLAKECGLEIDEGDPYRHPKRPV